MSSRPAELRKLEVKDLQREIGDKRSQAMKLRLGLQSGSEKDSSKHRRMKKEIARSLTVLNEKRRANDLKTAVKAPTVPAPKAQKPERRSSSKS